MFDYIREFGGGVEEPVSIVKQSVCADCGGTRFWMQCSEEDGVASRTCTNCKRAAFIGDSEDHWADADVGDATCPCGTKVFWIGVGYCLDAKGEVIWMIVGARCAGCGTVGVYADWWIDFEPTAALLERA